MILVVCHLSKGHNSVGNRNVMILLVCILSNKTAYLSKVWLKYLQLDERYGLGTIFIQKTKQNKKKKKTTRNVSAFNGSCFLQLF